MAGLLDIIYEDAALLVVNKPADLVCHPTKGDELSSLIARMRRHLGDGAVPRMVNRLDRETSGVVLAAKDSATARELGRLWEASTIVAATPIGTMNPEAPSSPASQREKTVSSVTDGSWEGRKVHKEYLAIVQGHVAEEAGSIDAALGEDLTSPVAIKNCVTASGQSARTDFQTLRRFSRDGADYSLLRVTPKTGRKHQIRIHLAHVGHPVLGDKIYGPDEQIYLRFVRGEMTEKDQRRMILPYQALHAGEVRLNWRQTDWCFQASPESWFMDFIAPTSPVH